VCRCKTFVGCARKHRIQHARKHARSCKGRAGIWCAGVLQLSALCAERLLYCRLRHTKQSLLCLQGNCCVSGAERVRARCLHAMRLQGVRPLSGALACVANLLAAQPWLLLICYANIRARSQRNMLQYVPESTNCCAHLDLAALGQVKRLLIHLLQRPLCCSHSLHLHAVSATSSCRVACKQRRSRR
jgi:hypothetical protein